MHYNYSYITKHLYKFYLDKIIYTWGWDSCHKGIQKMYINELWKGKLVIERDDFF